LGVDKGKVSASGSRKKIEGVDDDHLRHQIDLHLKRGRLFGKNQPPQVVAERVLLPVEKMVFAG
jgi:hypothetical protein